MPCEDLRKHREAILRHSMPQEKQQPLPCVLRAGQAVEFTQLWWSSLTVAQKGTEGEGSRCTALPIPSANQEERDPSQGRKERS